jgi:hypothetical protein
MRRPSCIHLLGSNAPFAILGCVAFVFISGSWVHAQETLVYSFEPDLEGFFGEPVVAITPSHETSGLGATHG